MSELQCVARLKIHDGKLDEFKRLAAKCAGLVRTKDTGTLQYELYFNSNNPSVLSLSGTATRRPSWIITRIWGTQWPRFFRHALGLENMRNA